MAACQLDREFFFALGDEGAGRKTLGVHDAVVPVAARTFEHVIHEAAGAAHVEVLVIAVITLAQCANIELGQAGVIVDIEDHLPRKRAVLELLRECRTIAGAHAVVQLERATLTMQPVRHRHDGRDADAARDQHGVIGAVIELECVARCADGDLVIGVQLLVQLLGSAPAIGLVQHGDAVTVRLIGRVEQ